MAKFNRKAEEEFGALQTVGVIILAILILLAVLYFLYKIGVFTSSYKLFGK